MITLSTEWLSVCGGCHVAILDLDLEGHLEKVLGEVSIGHCSVLVDVKDYPPADVGIIAGAIRSSHDREVARKMRESCKILIAFGTCAVYGGISGAAYAHTPDEIVDTVYRKNPTTSTRDVPDQMVPELEPVCLPLDDEVTPDLHLPGCPPHPSFIYMSLLSLLQGKAPKASHATVCARCKRTMQKSEVETLRRLSEGACDRDRCFLSEGYLCFGSVTLDRCLSPCPNNGMICTGCAGPTTQIIIEPNRDIRTELAERISKLTKIRYEDALSQLELFSKTHYAYCMASPLINQKNTFNIKKWIRKAEATLCRQ